MKDLLRGMEKIMKTSGRMINIFIFYLHFYRLLIWVMNYPPNNCLLLLPFSLQKMGNKGANANHKSKDNLDGANHKSKDSSDGANHKRIDSLDGAKVK